MMLNVYMALIYMIVSGDGVKCLYDLNIHDSVRRWC